MNRIAWRNAARILSNGVLLSVWGAVFWPTAAYAYVDPGSGSVIVTAVLGAIGAVGYTFRKYFYKIRAALSGRGKPDDE